MREKSAINIVITAKTPPPWPPAAAAIANDAVCCGGETAEPWAELATAAMKGLDCRRERRTMDLLDFEQFRSPVLQFRTGGAGGQQPSRH